jgi:WD40 repeat protein
VTGSHASPELPGSPYKGLNAFEDSELDALFFFGREREREIVVANLIASRLTVMYGPSGVGKSSLLRAGVARALRELPEEPLVVVFSSWSDDPNAALAEAVAETAGLELDGSAVAALERAQSDRDVYLVLDQAEEYFLYHADDGEPGSFAEALPAVLGSPLRVNVLISLREDSLAKLDRFTGRISSLFSNTLRLDRLDRESARATIIQPVERYSELTGVAVSVEPELVERVLDEVGAGQIEPGLGGLGTIEGGDSASRIEAPYLQLVMQRIWEEERATGSSLLRVETLERLGGAQRIVEEHLEGAMAELSVEQKDVAARLFNHLVTPSGTKIAHDVSDLADFGDAPIEDVLPVLSQLADRRILRSIEEGGHVRYEIFHDVLAQPVLAWRTRHRTEREIERQLAESHRRRRRLQWLFATVLVALGLMTAVSVFALNQRSEARKQAREAKAHELDAVAASELTSDPELSLLLALEAARLSPTRSTEETLREALLDSRVRTVVDLGEPVLGATVGGGRMVAVTSEGRVVVADAGTGKVLRATKTGLRARAASFADDGTALVTGVDGHLRVVDTAGSITQVPGVIGAAGAQISRGGARAAVLGNGVRWVDVVTGRVLQTFPHRGAISAAISPKGSRVVTGGADDTVRVWNTRGGGLVRRVSQHGDALAVAYSPRGDLIAGASSDGLGRVWRIPNGRLAATLSGHANYVTSVDFSTDGTQVVTGSRDRTARVWRADTGRPLALLAGHTDRITSAEFVGGAGSSVVTASTDGSVRIWDVLVQPVLLRLATMAAPVERIEVLDAHRVRVKTAVSDSVLDLRSGKKVVPGALPPLASFRSAVATDGTTATIRGNTVVLRSKGRTTILKGHRDRVTSVSFSADSRLLVTASRDHDVRIWDVASGLMRRVIPAHFGVVNEARFSPDGRWVVTAGPRTAGLWDARSGAQLFYLRGHVGKVTSALFDPTGRVIVTGGVDRTVRTYICRICGGIDELSALARSRLRETGRVLTDDERSQYLG